MSLHLEHGNGGLVMRITNQSAQPVRLTDIGLVHGAFTLYRYEPHLEPGQRLSEPMATNFPCRSCPPVRPDIHPMPAGDTQVHRFAWSEVNRVYFPARERCYYLVGVYRHRSPDGLVYSKASNALFVCR